MRTRCCIVLVAAFVLLAVHTDARSLDVRPAGQVQSVRAALELVRPGDTITVAQATYREHGLVIDKPLTLRGIDSPILDAEDQGPILEVTASNVTISGFVFRHVPTSHVKENAAIRLSSTKECEIADNVFETTFFAVYLAKSDHCRILRNRMIGTSTELTRAGNGIHLWYCRDIAIADNVIDGHRDGIYLEFVKHSEITNNTSIQNLRYGLHFMFSDSCRYENNSFIHNGSGVAVMYTSHVEMRENSFRDSWGGASYGLLLKDIKDSRVIRNDFSGNSVGIHMEGSDRVNIEANRFVANGWAIRIMANCVADTIRANDFIDNSFQVATNSRQSFSTFAENYWSTYRGYDLDRDGRGDESFRPVSLYSLLVESEPTSLILVRSLLIDLLNLAERIVPTLTPETLIDATPRMRPML